MQPQNLSLTSSHARCTTTTFSWDDIPDRGTGAKRCRVFHSMHATKVASECYISKFLDYEPANPLYQTLKDQKKIPNPKRKRSQLAALACCRQPHSAALRLDAPRGFADHLSRHHRLPPHPGRPIHYQRVACSMSPIVISCLTTAKKGSCQDRLHK